MEQLEGRDEMVERRILNSWKEIASYLGRGVRTVQRWEANLGLPIHRPSGRDHSAVLAFSNEMDQWLDSRPLRQSLLGVGESPSISNFPASEIQALLSRAEVLLEKLESVLSRSEEMHRRLSLAMDSVSSHEIRSDLNGDAIQQAAQAEAA